MLGTNDVQQGAWNLESFTVEYKAFLQELCGASACRLVLIGIPPKIQSVQDKCVNRDLSISVRTAAEALEMPLFDPRGAFVVNKSRKLYCADGVHLTSDGAQVLALVVFKRMIQEAAVADFPQAESVLWKERFKIHRTAATQPGNKFDAGTISQAKQQRQCSFSSVSQMLPVSESPCNVL
jgi:hypothetical protein